MKKKLKKNLFIQQIEKNVQLNPNKPCLIYKNIIYSYKQVWGFIFSFANKCSKKYFDVLIVNSSNKLLVVLSALSSWILNKSFLVIDDALPQSIKKNYQNMFESPLVVNNKDIDWILKSKPNYNPLNHQSNVFGSYVLTSGTTSNPKVVFSTIDNYLYSANFFNNFVSGVDLFVSISSLSSIAGLTFLLSTLFNNKTVLIDDYNFDFSNANLLNISNLLGYKPKCFTFLPPQILSNKLQKKEIKEDFFPLILTGSDKVTNIFSKEIKIVNCYGCSETNGACAYFFIDKKYKTTPISFKTNDIILVDKQMKEIKKKNIVGQIVVLNNVCKEYFKNDEETNKKIILFKNKRGYLTNDLGYWNNKNQLVFKQRADFIFNVSGKRIDPAEIETAILKNKHITSCLVSWFSFDKYSKINNDIRIFCKYTSNKKISVKNIIKNLKKEIPPNLIPHFFIRVKQLPLNRNKKINRLQNEDVPKLFNDYINANLKEESTSHLNKEQQDFLNIFKKILNIPNKKISMNDDFYFLGGTSIQLIRAIESLHEHFGKKISYLDAAKCKSLLEIWKLFNQTNCNKNTQKKQNSISPLSFAQHLLINRFCNINKKVNDICSSICLDITNCDLKLFKKSLLIYLSHERVFNSSFIKNKNNLIYKQKFSNSNKQFKIFNYNKKFNSIDSFLSCLKKTNIFKNDFLRLHIFQTHKKTFFVLLTSHLIIDKFTTSCFLFHLQKIIDLVKKRNKKELHNFLAYISLKDVSDFNYALFNFELNKKEKQKINLLNEKLYSFNNYLFSLYPSRKSEVQKRVILNSRTVSLIDKYGLSKIVIYCLSNSLKDITKKDVNYILFQHFGRNIFQDYDFSNTIGNLTCICPCEIKPSKNFFNFCTNYLSQTSNNNVKNYSAFLTQKYSNFIKNNKSIKKLNIVTSVPEINIIDYKDFNVSDSFKYFKNDDKLRIKILEKFYKENNDNLFKYFNFIRFFRTTDNIIEIEFNSSFNIDKIDRFIKHFDNFINNLKI